MPVLVTGATGFVGRRVAAALAESGHDLLLASRRDPAGEAGPPGARWLATGEIGPDTPWAEALQGVGAVVNLAARVHVAPERAEGEAASFDRVNHLGALRLFEAASAAGVPLFVQMSSITVLGPESPPDGALDERSPPRPDGPYARSKLAAEEGLRERAAACPGTRLAILRPPLVVGPGAGGNLLRLIRLANLPVPLPFGGLANRRTLLSLDNLAAALSRILARPQEGPSGTFVLGDARPLSTGAIVAALRAGLGRRPNLFPVPARPVAALAALSGRAGLHRRLFGDLAVDSSTFREAFGFSDVTDTEASLRAAAAAWRTGRR